MRWPQAPGPVFALWTVNAGAQNGPACPRAVAGQGGGPAMCRAHPLGGLGVCVKPQDAGASLHRALPLPDWNPPTSTGRLVGQGSCQLRGYGRWKEQCLLPVPGGCTVPGWCGAPALPPTREACSAGSQVTSHHPSPLSELVCASPGGDGECSSPAGLCVRPIRALGAGRGTAMQGPCTFSMLMGQGQGQRQTVALCSLTRCRKGE